MHTVCIQFSWIISPYIFFKLLFILIIALGYWIPTFCKAVPSSWSNFWSKFGCNLGYCSFYCSCRSLLVRSCLWTEVNLLQEKFYLRCKIILKRENKKTGTCLTHLICLIYTFSFVFFTFWQCWVTIDLQLLWLIVDSSLNVNKTHQYV